MLLLLVFLGVCGLSPLYEIMPPIGPETYAMGLMSVTQMNHGQRCLSSLSQALLTRMRLSVELRVLDGTLFVDPGKGGAVVGGIAVSRRGEERDCVAIMFLGVALLPDLVRAQDGRNAIELAPRLAHVAAEAQPDAALGRAAAVGCLRVGPKHLGHETLVARLTDPVAVDGADVVQRHAVPAERGRE